MTPEERAEKIAQGYAPCMSQDNVRHLSKLIAAQIREAVDERKGNPLAANPTEWFCLDCRPLIDAAVKQAVEEAEPQDYLDGREVGIRVGKAEAYEDAARIANHECSHECGRKVSDGIRARAKEVCK